MERGMDRGGEAEMERWMGTDGEAEMETWMDRDREAEIPPLLSPAPMGVTSAPP